VIQAWDADPSESWPDGKYREEEKKTKRYPSDLTDEEWERINPLLPKPAKRGRKPDVDLREVLNAIRYMARSGGGWRMLPRDFPPWQTVYWWSRRALPLNGDCGQS
jgi:putative transposase